MPKKKQEQEQPQQATVDQPAIKAEETPAAQATIEQTEETQEEKKPRIHGLIFTGDGEPKRKVRIGMLSLVLPDAAVQRAGFETEHAKLIRTNLKGYKPFNPLAKG